MRLIVFLTALAALLMTRPAAAISVCPISDFVLHYSDGDGAGLNENQLETVHAAVARSRVCDVQSIEVLVASHAMEQSLWKRRLEVVRSELIFGGIDESVIRVEAADNSQRRGDAANVDDDMVLVTVRFR